MNHSVPLLLIIIANLQMMQGKQVLGTYFLVLALAVSILDLIGLYYRSKLRREYDVSQIRVKE